MGVECPKTYLTIYCSKMTEVIKDDNLLVHFFHENLSGAAFDI
jgi:hypothetical protein